MINPQTIPFKTATDKFEITNLVLLFEFKLKPLPLFSPRGEKKGGALNVK
jgi:hypothetical protein